MRVRLICIVLAASAVAVTACGQTDDQKAARQTVDRFYAALKRHDAKTACGIVSPSVAAGMTKAAQETGKACVPALEAGFKRVGSHYYDNPPKTTAAAIRGKHAIVTIQLGYQRRKVVLTRTGDGWRITGSPDFGR